MGTWFQISQISLDSFKRLSIPSSISQFPQTSLDCKSLTHSCKPLYGAKATVWVLKAMCLSRNLLVLAPSLQTMSLSEPPLNFNQCSFSSISVARAASKKLSQAKWYQKWFLDAQTLTLTNLSLGTKTMSNSRPVLVLHEWSLFYQFTTHWVCYRLKRERLQSKVESKLTIQFTCTHSGHSIESSNKNHVVQQSMYVSGHSLTSDHANSSRFIVQPMLSNMKIVMTTMIFQLRPTTWMKTFLSPQIIPCPSPHHLIPITACPPPPLLTTNLWVQITLPSQADNREKKECGALFPLLMLPVCGTANGVWSPTGPTNSPRSIFLLLMKIILLLLLSQLLNRWRPVVSWWMTLLI